MGAGAVRRWQVAKDLVVVAMALLLAGAAYTAVLVVQRQTALAAASRYNLTWLVGQAGMEVGRLYGTVAASLVPGSGVDEDDVDLRLSIVENRIRLFENGEVAEFIATSPELGAIVALLGRTVAAARADTDRPESTGRARLLATISTLYTPIARLTAAANAYSGDMDASDRAVLSTLHWLFAGILTAVTACGLGLVAAISWHNRALARAQEVALRQNAVLHERDAALQKRNYQFDAALNNMSQALCMVDGAGRLIVCNTRFTQLFGLQAGAVWPGMPVAAMFPSDGAGVPFGAMMAGGVLARQEAHGRDGLSIGVVEQDAAGHALTISQEPLADGGWVATYEDITDRRRTEARIHHMAHHDTLTDLPNRVWFQARLEEAFGRWNGDGQGLVVLCVDLDRFKQVNDMYGHMIGDELLRQVADRLRTCVRRDDLVARLGGDEFAILQTGVGSPEAAAAVAGRIVHELGLPYDLRGNHVAIGASVGVAVCDGSAASAAALLNSADIALYRAKGDGKDTFRFFEATMGHEVRTRRQMELDLQDALERGEFVVFYQPLYHLASDTVSGFEALLRWRHPAKGMIPPATFIPVAEEIGLIVPLGDWVLRQACADAAGWPAPMKVAVNLSPVQFRNRNLAGAVQEALDAAGLAASRLDLEITESLLLNSSEAVQAVLRELRELGVHLSLDDFGTGYSSLSYLHSFPFTKVKIDRSFIKDITVRPECGAIVRAVVGLASSLGMTTVAEGVETVEQLDCVRTLRCGEVQGYLFDQPRPLEQLGRWLPAARAARVEAPGLAYT